MINCETSYINYKIRKKKTIYNVNLHLLIQKFICDKGLLLYGGEAINILLLDITNGKVSIYDNNINDYDVISMNGFDDIYELKDILIDNGYKYTYVRRAIHPSTYKIFTNLNSDSIIDITTISKDQFSQMSPIMIRGSYYGDIVYTVNPQYIKIDQYKNISSNYYRDNYRFVNALKRIKLLEKYFPIKDCEFLSDINKITKIPKLKEDCVIGGDVAFNFCYPGRIENPVPGRCQKHQQ